MRIPALFFKRDFQRNDVESREKWILSENVIIVDFDERYISYVFSCSLRETKSQLQEIYNKEVMSFQSTSFSIYY